MTDHAMGVWLGVRARPRNVHTLSWSTPRQDELENKYLVTLASLEVVQSPALPTLALNTLLLLLPHPSRSQSAKPLYPDDVCLQTAAHTRTHATFNPYVTKCLDLEIEMPLHEPRWGSDN
ncbi:unnamed protein product [Mesocestoides corti]|uniref:Uncharacterized protein n=2 Tax=Mesocestoides corti TaxID=53468 RepID=A0A0R3U2D8_MESCO|nr:unnamed protein product [Mesocestoides corti]